MSNYSVTATGVGPLTINDMTGIDLSFGADQKKLPNKKVSLDIHTANGGYVVKVSKNFSSEDDMYIVSDDQDLGQELGKIVMHYTLSKQ